MKKLMITGAAGFLASRTRNYYTSLANYEVTGLTRNELDITNADAVKFCLERKRPDIVFHCAAVSDVAACAAETEGSWAINVDGTRHLAYACKNVGAKLVFCSSDQVYMGSPIREPHLETEQLHPPHPYGQQKLAAECEVMDADSDHICLRLSMMYAMDYHGKKEHSNFIQNMISSIQTGTELRYPIYDFRDISDVWDIVRSMEQVFLLPGGIYNIANRHEGSTWDLAASFLNHYNQSITVLKNEEAFADELRNLRMNTVKLADAGVILESATDRLLMQAEQFEKAVKMV